MAQYSRRLAKGVKWFYKFDHLEKTYFSKCIFDTKGKASKAERDHRNFPDEQGRLPVYSEITLRDLIDERLKFIQTKKSNKYYRGNKFYLDMLYDYVGNTKVSLVNKNDINSLLMQYSKFLKQNNKDNHAVNSMLRVIKALFNYGINILDLKIENPCNNLGAYPVNIKLKYVPSDDEINKLLDVCSPEEKRLVEFVRDTYCRINEAIRLAYADINKEYVVLYTHKSRNSNLTPRKVKKPDCLKSINTPKDDTIRVFNHWSDLPRFLEKKLKLLNMRPWGWHNLRHRGASLMSKRGVPLYEIMEKLGHSNLSTSQKYLQLIS
ncbi:MAG: tyrosine-type recombinase/integrase [Candidatus Kapabacteria bacterium]|nr:tyrosine-type recombinase/integrase [Candidatus Kapabacteria bacterium]